MIGSGRNEVSCEASLLSRVNGRTVGPDSHTAAVRLVVVVAINMVACGGRNVRNVDIETDR